LGSDRESLNKRIRETVSELSDDALYEMLRAPTQQYTAFARQVAEEVLRRRRQRTEYNRFAEGSDVEPKSLREKTDKDKRSGCFIEVWSEKNFEGEHLHIDGPVEHQTLDFTKLNWSNSISSLRVGPTAFVLVYAEQDFNGPLMSFGPGEDVPDLGQLNFNDQIDSIRLVNSMRVFDGARGADASVLSSAQSRQEGTKAVKQKKRSRRNH